jgi:hypothetical protein
MTLTPDRRRELLEAYGADPARWPEDEAVESGTGRLDSVENGQATDLRRAWSEAGRLDGLLNLYTVQPSSGALRKAVLAVPERAVDIRDVTKPERRGTARPAWSLIGALRGAIPQLTGLAIASVLGFMVGATDLLPPTHDRSVSVDASGLVIGEDATIGGFDS